MGGFDLQVIGGKEGEQHAVYTVQQNGWPMGTLMMFADGRKYRFYKNGATAQVAGQVCTGVLPSANHLNMSVASAGAIGDTSIAVTLGGSTTVAGLYDDGYINIDVTPGAGYNYKLANGQPASVSTALTVNLARGETLRAALTATTSKATLMRNNFDSNIVCATTPGVNAVGVAVSVVAASASTGWGWMQTAGTTAVLTDGTVVAGNIVVPSSNTAGDVMAATNDLLQPIGIVRRLSASAAYSTVQLIGLE